MQILWALKSQGVLYDRDYHLEGHVKANPELLVVLWGIIACLEDQPMQRRCEFQIQFCLEDPLNALQAQREQVHLAEDEDKRLLTVEGEQLGREVVDLHSHEVEVPILHQVIEALLAADQEVVDVP